MKEIKEFVDMMEYVKNYYRNKGDAQSLTALFTVELRPEFEALKALVDKPVAKVEVTDEILNIADAHYQVPVLTDHSFFKHRIRLKAALQAVFDHIGGADKPIERTIDIKNEVHKPSYHAGWNDCLESLEEDSKQDAEYSHSEKPDSSESNDRWIEWKGEEWPESKRNATIRVRKRDNTYYEGIADKFYFGWSCNTYKSGQDVIAYRIIDEPKESKWDAPENHYAITGTHLKPKRQTLLEYMDEKAGYKGTPLPRHDFERRETYRNISEYLELHFKNR